MAKRVEATSESIECSASTTWEWKRVKITTPPSGPAKRSPKAAPRPSLSPWRRRDPLTVTIRHRGGAESWWEIKARGHVWRAPGWMAIEDVMSTIHQGGHQLW